jgi:hypothetical protein
MTITAPKFATTLQVEHVSGKWWRLTSDLVYQSALINAVITAPAGFVTDFASVPRLPLAYWLFGSRANAPAVIHDRFYRWGDVSRHTADKIFNEAMKSTGSWAITRWPMTGAVMGFGWLTHNPQPGCLDYRAPCTTGPGCLDCETYHDQWSATLRYLEPKS